MDLGIAFQLMDDILDYVAREEDFGKSIGHDLEEGKVTLPLIEALRHCTEQERELVAEVVTRDEPEESDFDRVLALVRTYGGIEYTTAKARAFVAAAKTHLDIFADSPARSALLRLADYVVARER
jgi:octaprenyl-diphosphate synthase